MNTPTKLTLTRLCLIPLFVLFLTPMPPSLIKAIPSLMFVNLHGMTIATIIFVIAAGTDKLDGFLARKYNQVTKLGTFLDPLVDKMLVTAALLCFVGRQEVSTWIAVVILGREFMVTALRFAASSTGVVLAADRYGKLKFGFQVAAILLTLLNNYPLSLFTSFRVDSLVMSLTAIITVLSGINYVARNARLFSSPDVAPKKIG